MKTPYFIINQKELDENLGAFQNALKELWPNSHLGYSVKTNSLPWLLSYLKQKDVYAEVVSDEEYQLALLCGYTDDHIIFNGPIKGEETFSRACRLGAYVNVDSKNDLHMLAAYADKDTKLGVRVNPDPSLFKEKDIAYQEDGFRFGFSDATDELAEAIRIIRTKTKGAIGLHMHCNSVTRSIEVYAALAKYAAELVKKYHLSVSYIDIGGGFFGGVPGKPTALDYIQAIKDKLLPVIDTRETTLIVEPGSAAIASAVDYCTSVIDVKNTARARIVTTDGSRIHIDPLWAKQKYLYSLETDSTDTFAGKQIICGYTCMDHDRLMSLCQTPELCIGDRIIYHKVGAYSMTFGGMFIRYFPEVYVRFKRGEIKLIRSRMTVDEYCQVQRCNK